MAILRWKEKELERNKMAKVKQVLKTFVVFLIPALITIDIESVDTSNPHDDMSWLRYRAVISILSIL